MSEASQQACPSCGAVSPPDAQFCHECGAILVRSAVGSRPTPLTEEPAPSLPPSPSLPPTGGPRRGRTVALIVAAVVALIVAFLVREHERTSSDLPVPGVPVAEATAPAPSGEPTAALPNQATAEIHREVRPSPAPRAPVRSRAEDTIEEPPPREASREAESAREAGEPQSPSEPQARPGDRRASAAQSPDAVPEVVSRLRPGWYRVRFRAPLFREPSETAPVVTYLPIGTRIHVTRVLPGFLAVESMTGKAPGYVSTDDAAPEGS